MSILPHSGTHKPATLENQTHVCDIYDWECPQDEGPRHVPSHTHGEKNKLHPLIVHRTRCTSSTAVIDSSTEYDVHPARPSSTRPQNTMYIQHGRHQFVCIGSSNSCMHSTEQTSFKATPLFIFASSVILGWVHTCNVTAYRNTVS